MGKLKKTVAQQTGKIQGYNAMWMRFEDDGRSIILLSNSNMADLKDFAEQIRKELYAKALADKKSKGKKTNS